MAPSNDEKRLPLPGSARLAIGFAILIALGTIFLRLPAATVGPSLGWVDALFTSTSAVCVTGLATVSVGERLSPFGQVAVLVLIQLGALGITTMSTFLLLAAGRATLAHVVEAGDQLAAVRVRPLRLLAWVFATTIVAEALGAVVLARHLSGEDDWWQAIFHSVSAFCNAGFSTYPESLVRFQSDGLVQATIMVLIMLGGIGFIALYQTGRWLGGVLTRRRAPLFLHARVVLAGSVALWLAGTGLFLALEWSGTLGDHPAGDKLLNGLFQSVTTRTAGFNTLDFGSMREITLFGTMFLMLIGGAPGGVAGGVKVTTALVILAAVRARIRNIDAVPLFQRTIPTELVRRAYQLVTLALLFLALVIALLLITEEALPNVAGRTDHFMMLAFEAVSAFGTVGLSTGITPELSTGGKLIITVCMFVGRIGPLALALAVFRPQRRVPYEYPREELAIG